MRTSLIKNDQISICDGKQNCIHATGKNANMIANAAAAMLLFIGIAALMKAV